MGKERPVPTHVFFKTNIHPEATLDTYIETEYICYLFLFCFKIFMYLCRYVYLNMFVYVYIY